jgi:transposase
MEATGVYHESLAYFLHDKGYSLSVVLPNRISHYFRTPEVKTITGKIASETIARFGLERNPEPWQKTKDIYKQLRQLSREREQILPETTMLNNQIHAENAEARPNKKSLTRMRERLRIWNRQERQIMVELRELVATDKDIQQMVLIIGTLPGVALLTAVTVLAETNGFELVRNRRQLTSYAGFDVREKQSGTSVRGKARISKRGNKFLRKAMYFPALTAIRTDPRFKALYDRLVARHGLKMKAAVAVQRRLPEMIYVIFTSGKAYDKNYLQQQPAVTAQQGLGTVSNCFLNRLAQGCPGTTKIKK